MINRFLKNLVHATLNCFINKVLFSVSCKCWNYWLSSSFFVQILSDLYGCLVTVHHGHVAVHENQTKAALVEPLALILIQVFLNELDGLITVKNMLAKKVGVNIVNVAQNDLDCINIENLVIHNQYLPQVVSCFRDLSYLVWRNQTVKRALFFWHIAINGSNIHHSRSSIFCFESCFWVCAWDFLLVSFWDPCEV